MKAIINRHIDRYYYLTMIFMFIFGDIICNNYILKSFNNKSHTLQFFSFLSLLVLQVIASPIQAALSDLYCRKKSLVFSLAMSLLSLILVYFYTQTEVFFLPMLCITIALKGLFGNTIPLSFAAIADVRNKKIRLSFGVATFPYTAGYFWIIFTNKALPKESSLMLAMIILLVLVIVCWFVFEDRRDKTSHKNQRLHLDRSLPTEISHEVGSVIHVLHNFSNQMAFLAYLMWEISLYSILLLYIDFDVQTFSSVGISMLSGAAVAVLILKFSEVVQDEKMIQLGYKLSAFSLTPFFLIYPFLKDLYLLNTCYFFHAMGNVILSASLFALMAKRTTPHEGGKIYGLLDSVDTIAFSIASIFIMIYNNFDLKLIYLILFSFAAITISWIPYVQFRKSKSGAD